MRLCIGPGGSGHFLLAEQGSKFAPRSKLGCLHRAIIPTLAICKGCILPSRSSNYVSVQVYVYVTPVLHCRLSIPSNWNM